MKRDFCYDLIETLKGGFAVVFSEQGIYEIIFPQEAVELPWVRKELPWPQLKADLNRYLDGEEVDWSSYPLDHSGYAPFTARLLQEMGKIPYGTVCTYREMAEKAGSPRAWRAAGQACGANRHPVIVP